jgi:hypothetical protein
MGKKKGTADSSASAGAAKIGRDWCASTISNRVDPEIIEASEGLDSRQEADETFHERDK